MIAVEKSIPIFDKNLCVPRGRYPWRAMEVGDSFFVQTGARSSVLPQAAHEAGKRLGMKFSVRRVEGGLRVWRTA